jgi:DNA-binding protein YbaB
MELEQRARERLMEAAELQQRLAAVRATAADRTGTVTVTVDATGHVLDLEFARTAADTTPDRLRTASLEAIAAAHAAADEQLARATEGLASAASLQDMIRGKVPAETLRALEDELAKYDEDGAR